MNRTQRRKFERECLAVIKRMATTARFAAPRISTTAEPSTGLPPPAKSSVSASAARTSLNGRFGAGLHWTKPYKLPHLARNRTSARSVEQMFKAVDAHQAWAATLDHPVKCPGRCVERRQSLLPTCHRRPKHNIGTLSLRRFKWRPTALVLRCLWKNLPGSLLVAGNLYKNLAVALFVRNKKIRG